MSVNVIAMLLAAGSSMVVGAVWFHPAVFGTRWTKLTGVDPNKPRAPALVYPLAFGLAAFTATGLSLLASVIFDAVGGNALGVTLVVAVIAWLGFSAATTAVHCLFEGRNAGIYAINMGHQLVTIVIMALIIGLFGF